MKVIVNGEEWTFLQIKELRGREKEFYEGAVIGNTKTIEVKEGRLTWINIFNLKLKEATTIILHDNSKGEELCKEAKDMVLENDIKELQKDG